MLTLKNEVKGDNKTSAVSNREWNVKQKEPPAENNGKKREEEQSQGET